ncbi:MAG: ParB/RepB/Spo0J family partition protein [Oscillospiraceae bacterium]
MGKKDRIKNGLDALFEDNFHESVEKAEKNDNSVKMVRVSLLEPNKNQPRQEFDLEKLQELSANIATHGVLQPILVRPLENGGYQIVAGERRWRAARMAEIKEVPVYVRELSDLQVAQVSLVENLQRENLNPIEEAEAYSRLATDFNMTHDEIANTVGKSRSQITNSLRLLKLCDSVKKLLVDGKITAGHAKILAAVDSESTQEYFAQAAADTNMSVRTFEKFVSGFQKEEPENTKSKEKKKKEKKENPYLVEAKIAIEKEFGRKTLISEEKNGEITLKITFSDLEDFKEKMAKIKG